MMRKKQFFIDFDGTIVNSIKAFCDTYNLIYREHENFIPADWEKVNVYNMKDQCSLIKDVNEIFTNPYFFWTLQFINENTYTVLKKLNKKYNVIICSIGVAKNIAFKANWLERKLPFIKEYILISNNGCKMNKSIINMKNSIFGDDIISNLKSSNAKEKFLFGQIYPWNEGWQGEHCLTWTNIEEKYL